MNNLVFMKNGKPDLEPFTTSEVIAENAEVQHHAVQQLITTYKSDLKEFGQVAFDMRAVKYERGTNEKKVYRLNEQQATLLLTYMQNTVPVRRFKKALVKEFYAMRLEFMKLGTVRLERKDPYRTMTDLIKERGHSKWDYKLYNDLAYKAALGKTAAQIRKDMGADKKADAADFLTSEEHKAVIRRIGQIVSLLELGMDYQEIKAALHHPQAVKKIA